MTEKPSKGEFGKYGRIGTPEQEQEKAKLLKQFQERNAVGAAKYKQIFEGFFMAAKEYTERTGQQPPEVLFLLNDDTFRVSQGETGDFDLKLVDQRSRDKQRGYRQDG